MTIETVDTQVNFERMFASQQAKSHQLPALVPVNADSYYRSRIYTASAGLNALVTAASPLLSLLPRLIRSTHWPDVATVREYIEHELKAFETQAIANQVNDEIILLARLILTAAIEDGLLKNKQSHGKEWQHFYTFGLNETPLEEHFFSILARAQEYPVAHIDLLELIYLCLVNGYQGKFRRSKQKQQELRNIQDNLYNIIYQQRQFHDTQLNDQTVAQCQKLLQVKKPKIKKYGVVILLLIGVLYTMVNYTIEIATEPMMHQITNITEQVSHMSNPLE